jgi:probable addiction module antidote protein
MPRRSKDWNKGLAEDLKDPEFACEFIISALEEDIPLQVALGKVIRALGIKEFSEKTGIPSPNIVRALNPDYNPTQETLNALLKPLGLRLTVSPINTAA